MVQVPDADGVHVIVPDGTEPSDAARVAIALVLGLDPVEIAVEVSPGSTVAPSGGASIGSGAAGRA